MTKVKFCGLKRPEEIEAVNQLQPDYIGFVFYEKSKRALDMETALRLKKLLKNDIKTVGVFVNETPETIAGLYEKEVIDVAQLHGTEDEDYIRALRKISPVQVIKALKMPACSMRETAKSCGENENRQDTESENRQELKESLMRCTADGILLDAGMGEGKTFDWSLLEGIERPYFLAGGLDCDNIGEVMKQIRPYAVDVSSGIETNSSKDLEKMKLFLSIVRNMSVK